MKKIAIFAVAVSLSGGVFANNLENSRLQSTLTTLDAKIVTSMDITMPAATKEKSWSYTPEYFMQRTDSGNFVCKNKSGIKGYNKLAF